MPGEAVRFAEFRNLLSNLSTVIHGQPDPSVHKRPMNGPRAADIDGDPASEDWWLKASAGTHPGKARTQAFLTAYVAAVGLRIPAAGAQLDDAWFWPDRDVMKCLIVAGYVRFIPGGLGHFELTQTGIGYLRAPHLNYSGG